MLVAGPGRHGDPPTQAPSRKILRQDRGELLERPVDLVAGDHQRRGDADRVFMGILGEDALALEGKSRPGRKLSY